ncbi:MAG: Do family serine endopeptidase [Treponema sp.]|nr:Do family serine endopeptidase [Treponema sp.]
MKHFTKKLISISLVAVLAVSLFADPASAKKTQVNKTQSLSVVEALQTSFRNITSEMLPAVVEVDVTETKTYTNPMRSLPFFFFGNPDDEDSDKGKREYESKGLGSGVIVRRDGNTLYVLTNNHVAGGATKISVKLNDEREFVGKLVGADERIDIALVSFESSDKSIPVAPLGNSDDVMAGDICMAFGAPLGYRQSVTQGIVSAVGRDGSGIGSISDFIQTDAAINQGNSGGPLVNIYGEVIGINTWIASRSGGSNGLGFAIPINNVKNAIDSFISGGKIKYGWVGVSLLDVTPEFKKELGVEGIDGAFAAEVFTGSPAFKCGVKAGDYIVELNGKPVKSVNQLVRDVGNLQVGTTARFIVIRGGVKQPAVNVKIEERTDEVVNANNKLWPGFMAMPLTDEARKQLDIDDKKLRGVIVSNVQAKTPAATLRLQNGDIITAVNGKSIKNIMEFYEELAKADKTINFDVYSNGGTLTTGTFKIR